ncbi:hypothetical protein MASR1M101_30490 [Gemmatimonas sp.]
MVALFSVAIVGMAAFAIDLSRLYVGTNELQTRADATALNAALLLQRNPATAQLSASATFASNNEVMGARKVLANSAIEPGVWNPTTRSFAASAWTTANAVRVTAVDTGRLLFGRAIAATSAVPTRRAIAWVANLNGSDCLRPWGISQSLFPARFSFDLTTQAGVNSLRTTLNAPNGPANLTIILSPNVNAGTGGGGNGNGNGGNGNGNGGNGNGNGGQNNTVLAPDDFYQAVTGDQNASPNSHANLILGTECGNGIVERAAGTTFAQPNSGAAVVNEAGAIVQQNSSGRGPCRKSGTNDATCFSPDSVGLYAGPVIVVPLTVPAAGNGQPNQVRINTLTEFRLMCAFTTPNTGNPLGPSPDSCPWLATIGRPATGYRRGTIVGYPLAGAMDLGNGNVLGNAPSTGQRLILVQ